jgi:hypothetical protein
LKAIFYDAAQVSTAFSDYVFWSQLKNNVNINFQTSCIWVSFSLNLISHECTREKGIECGSSVSPWSFYQIAGKGAASGWLARERERGQFASWALAS